jgi:hypothetical protein
LYFSDINMFVLNTEEQNSIACGAECPCLVDFFLQ